MAIVKIEDVPPLDGSYELDTGYFTNREFHLIKQVAGIRAGEMDDAMKAGDVDLMVALAAVALKRAGVDAPIEALWDARFGAIAFDFSDGEEPAEGNPPAPQGAGHEPNGSGDASESSGESSSATLASPA